MFARPDTPHSRRSGHRAGPRAVLAACALGAALAVAGVAGPARAGGVPVFDAAAQAQAIKDALEQARQLEQLVRQLANMKRRLEAITGPRDVAFLLRSAAGLADEAGLGDNETLDTLIEVARAGAGALGPGHAGIADRLGPLTRRLGLDGLADLGGDQRPTTRGRAETAATGLATAAMAGVVHDRASAIATDLRGQMGRAGTAPDLKAAMDENTAAVLQLTVLVADLVRLEAARARLEGTQAAAQARGGLADSAFFSAPKQ